MTDTIMEIGISQTYIKEDLDRHLNSLIKCFKSKTYRLDGAILRVFSVFVDDVSYEIKPITDINAPMSARTLNKEFRGKQLRTLLDYWLKLHN